eukprot:TRINITY_DN16511_c0_g1_i1.p1 TRINITY_DN16511_c0_g1~~TRINITY_DN16511_c0_g1_i1.p1  ORF type:complete len:400 (+),score=69.48 TRINITY_DN16511_c0_g1_i1:35-1234(+)
MVHSYHPHSALECRTVSPRRRINAVLDSMPASGEVLHNFTRSLPTDPLKSLEHELKESAKRRIKALQGLEGKRRDEDVENRLLSLEDNTTGAKEQRDSLGEKISQLEARLEGIGTDLDDAAAKDDKIEKLEAKIQQLTERNESLEERVTSLETLITEKVENLESAFTQKLTNLEQSLHTSNQQAAAILTTQTLDEVTNQIETLENRQQEVEGTTTNLIKDQNATIETMLVQKIGEMKEEVDQEREKITKRLDNGMTDDEVKELRELALVIKTRLRDLESKEVALHQQQEASLRGLDAANSALQRLSGQVNVLEGKAVPNHLSMGVPHASSASGVAGVTAAGVANPIKLPASQPFPSSFPTPVAKTQALGRTVSPTRQPVRSAFPYSATPDAYADILSPR